MYVFSVQGRRLLGKQMAHFNYEMLYDVKTFLYEFNVQFRIVFMADNEISGGDKKTLTEGAKLLKVFFPESLSKDLAQSKFDYLCQGIELVWDKKFFSLTNTPQCAKTPRTKVSIYSTLHEMFAKKYMTIMTDVDLIMRLTDWLPRQELHIYR